MNINNIFLKLSEDNSRLAKLAILQDNKDNELFKRVLHLALSPNIQFYIRKIPAYTSNSSNVDLSKALDELSALSDRVVTGHAGIRKLTDILSSLSADDARVVELIIKKDIRCGVQESSVNKIWPGIIPEWPTMLCSPFTEKLVNKIKYPAMAQLKMDGMRFNAVVVGGECSLYSRSGKEIDLLGNLHEGFIEMADKLKGGWVFDGELVVSDGQGGDGILDRQTGNGILNKAVKGTVSIKEAALVRARIWDVVAHDEFSKGKGTLPYAVRFDTIRQLLPREKIELVEYFIVSSLNEATYIFERYLAEGEEGIILKDLNGIWEDKRAKHQIKFKAEKDCDLVIVGLQEGAAGSKYQGMLGALLCESREGTLKVSVGSGLSDAQRILDQSIVGKIAAVKYNTRISNRQEGESLFLPRLLEIREDKFEADPIDTIK